MLEFLLSFGFFFPGNEKESRTKNILVFKFSLFIFFHFLLRIFDLL